MSSSQQSLPAVSPANGTGLPADQPAGTNGAGLDPSTNGAAALGPHELLRALQAMQVGDFSVRMPGNLTGLEGKIADTFNTIVASNQRMAQQLERVGQLVGREGKARHRVRFG